MLQDDVSESALGEEPLDTELYLAETFTHVQTWDDVVQEAANLRRESDLKKFALGDLVNFACPRRRPGNPGRDKRWNVTRLAAAIGESRAVLSQLAANAEFWVPSVRDELPPQVSWRMLARARVDSGWQPGEPVTKDVLLKAMDQVLKMADGEWTRKRRIPTAKEYAARLVRVAARAMEVHRDDISARAWMLFRAIHQTSETLLKELGGGSDE